MATLAEFGAQQFAAGYANGHSDKVDSLATLNSVKLWMETMRSLHQGKGDTRTTWPLPGMDARYREVCAAIEQAEGR